MKNILSITLLLFLSSTNHFSQFCQNANFEMGTLDEYVAYTGNISGDGTVTINTLGPGQTQHVIMHKNDGNDPIAAMNCIINNELPVVAPDGGQFAMRLGNSQAGGKAERIVLDLTVTPDLTFFLLRYCVILNDPGHEDIKQPRFELRILDNAGNELPCGEYKVRASADIPGFENCGDWRVRPWTTVGFELQSFLGQDIKIEILTTDCALSAHAGYAYFDATCQPLTIDLNGYCPDSTSATMSVTSGFTKYEWNTGDSTSTISIDTPLQGTPYFVTVTSATGCTIVLSDTVPEIEEFPTPEFLIPQTSIVCPNDIFWFHPEGDNLYEIYCVELGYAADSFLLSPLNFIDYTFIGSDKYGCKFDTLIHSLDVLFVQLASEIVTPVSCSGGSDGSILLGNNFANVLWSNGETSNGISNIEAGEYSVTLTNDSGCTITQSFSVTEPNVLSLDYIIDSISCLNGNDGGINISPSGGTPPYGFEWSQGTSFTATISNLSEGMYEVTVVDSNQCIVSETINILNPLPIHLQIITTNVSCSGGNDGTATVIINGGTPYYNISWNDSLNQNTETAIALPSGIYTVTVTDGNGCTTENQTTIQEPPPLHLSIEQDNGCPDGNSGSAIVTPSGGTPSYSFLWSDAQNQTTSAAHSLSSGVYTVTVIDNNGCEIIGQTMIDPPPPSITLSIYTDSISCNGESNGQITILPSGGTPSYSYYWAPPINQSTQEINNLEAGTYQVTIIDNKGCGIIEEIEVFEPQPLVMNSIESNLANCNNNIPGNNIIDVNGGTVPYFYHWETGSTSDTLESFTAGEYAVTVTDNNGCSSENVFEIQGIDIELSALGLTIDSENQREFICLGDSIFFTITSSNGIESISWNSSIDLDCYNCLSVSGFPINNSWVQAELTDTSGCKTKKRFDITVNKNCTTAIPNVFTPNGDGINDFFYVIGSKGGYKIEKFLIFSRWGELVFEGSQECKNIGIRECGWNGKFNGQPAMAGIYVYLIELSFYGISDPVQFKGDVLLKR